jgi:hypothetical protein
MCNLFEFTDLFCENGPSFYHKDIYDWDTRVIMEHVKKTNVTPYELLTVAIYKKTYVHNSSFFRGLISRLSKKDATQVFRFHNVTHTLLTFLCCRISEKDNQTIAKDTISLLCDAGCQLDQEVEGGKTALSFLVMADEFLYLVKWCIEEKGATPQKGHLLVYNYNGFPLQYTDETLDSLSYPRTRIFSYLVSSGVSVEDVVDDTGMTPLLTACEERNLYKVKKLLENGACISKKNNQGNDVWFFANKCKYRNENNDYVYPLRELLQNHEAEQKRYWQQMMEETTSQLSLLQDVPIGDILQAVTSL